MIVILIARMGWFVAVATAKGFLLTENHINLILTVAKKAVSKIYFFK